MRRLALYLGLLTVSGVVPVWAVPGTVENNDYKVTLSETLPGLDDQTSLQAPPTITAAVQDKFRSTQTLFPLNFYAIHQFFLDDDRLNLLGRLNRQTSPEGPRYCFLQISLSNQPDSRQFQPLKKYFFSPDNQFLLAVFDGKDQPDPIGFIRLSEAPAQLGWLLANGGAVNLFHEAFPTLDSPVTLNDPVGWSADSRTCVFVVSVPLGVSTPEASPDPQTQPVIKNYLVSVDLTRDRITPAVEPLDLSAYHYGTGAVITQIVTDGRNAVLTFNRNDSADTIPVTFALPTVPTPTP
jgi:hypothetical protein